MNETIKGLIYKFNFFQKIIADTADNTDYVLGYYGAMEDIIKLMCADTKTKISITSRQGRYREYKEIKIL